MGKLNGSKLESRGRGTAENRVMYIKCRHRYRLQVEGFLLRDVAVVEKSKNNSICLASELRIFICYIKLYLSRRCHIY